MPTTTLPAPRPSSRSSAAASSKLLLPTPTAPHPKNPTTGLLAIRRLVLIAPAEDSRPLLPLLTLSSSSFSTATVISPPRTATARAALSHPASSSGSTRDAAVALARAAALSAHRVAPNSAARTTSALCSAPSTL
jgi:hypothetical protein